ncbi:DUF2326 domain-containing protein [Bacillus sp. FJAT-49711]|uniref:DUF2326 domain-containing protein n=1 Tax=Bacillus sp. FJAT-49711 TaxID=2833585 RepID=UPI001BC92B6D|nr:DUF2326 domain-containing protein [Bacillus sp. FJAT-49711]MBS4217490.1 DUF2326 domain-containing protein [Bacillus sp. FJAT-49711]
MILKELSIYSFNEKKVLNSYRFNDVGLNIILGEKKDEADEANGVGKTTMVECLSFLLGEEVHPYYKNNKILISKNILITLEISANGIIYFLGRYFNTPEKGYILYDKKANFDLNCWEPYEDKDYKTKIQEIILGDKVEEISFASIREYIIRDEQNGFIKDTLGISGRNATTQNKVLAFLCNLPYNSESEIKKITKRITELKDEKKALSTTIGKTISELRSEKSKYTNQIKKLEKDINSININKQYNIKVSEYSKNKNELNKIQNKIFKLLHVKNQYQQNIENLKQKVEDIKGLNDIEPFYKQLLGTFPNEVSHNYENVKKFYDFMVDNRGKFYEGKIESIDNDLEELNTLKASYEEKLKEDYKILKSSNIVEDINSMISNREDLNTKIAEINIQINNHDRLKNLTNKINSLKSERLLVTQKKTDEFTSYEQHILSLETLFQTLSELAYDTDGILNIEFDNNVNDRKNSITGRVIIECSLPDDRSHGINYMKINMFDLTWFLSSLSGESGHNINFLIHDGSYSKPNPSVKAKILKFVDTKIKSLSKGQYFVTINKDEVLKKDIDFFEKNGNIIAKLERTDDNSKRFFGFKLYDQS